MGLYGKAGIKEVKCFLAEHEKLEHIPSSASLKCLSSFRLSTVVGDGASKVNKKVTVSFVWLYWNNKFQQSKSNTHTVL